MAEVVGPDQQQERHVDEHVHAHARPGTWNLLRWYSHLIVMSSRAIPYNARPPSAVAVFIESTKLAMRQMMAIVAECAPMISSSGGHVERARVARAPDDAPNPSGSST